MSVARVAAALGAVLLVITVAGCGLRDRGTEPSDNGISTGTSDNSNSSGTSDDALNQVLKDLQTVDAAANQVDGDLASGGASEANGE